MNAQLHVLCAMPVCSVVLLPPCRTGPEGFVGNEEVTVMAAHHPVATHRAGWDQSPRQHEPEMAIRKLLHGDEEQKSIFFRGAERERDRRGGWNDLSCVSSERAKTNKNASKAS